MDSAKSPMLNSSVLSSLPSTHYQLLLPWGCNQCCDYCCKSKCDYVLGQCQDDSYSQPQKIGDIHQEHICLWQSRDPFVANLTLQGQPTAISRRIFKCCAPCCDTDEIAITTETNQPLGSCKAVGCMCLNVQVFDKNERMVYYIEKTCEGQCNWTFNICDSMEHMVGRVEYEACTCCSYIMDLAVPEDASAENKLILIMATHFLSNIVREVERKIADRGIY